VRFEPGQQRTVELVDFAGDRVVYGFRGLVQRKNSRHGNDRTPRLCGKSSAPPWADRVRLADTDLVIEVEEDYTLHAGGYGEEVKFGGGKTIRGRHGPRAKRTRAEGTVDTVMTNALILDHWGIVKADIGLKGGPHRRHRQGPGIIPDVQPGVDIVIGPGTEVISCEGNIVTTGGIDSHIHFICPQQIEEALASGVTTMLGGGTGPATGTFATTATPGPWHIERMLQALMRSR